MQFLQLMISGVSQGCIYGLIALGFVLIYKGTETVSFAQGELMMLGAFGGLACMTLMGFPFWLAILSAIAGMALFGMALERAELVQRAAGAVEHLAPDDRELDPARRAVEQLHAECRLQPRHGHPERRAGDVVQAHFVEEVHGLRIATVLSGTDKAAKFAEKVTLATLAYSSRRLGEIADDAFSRRFFGIWLSPKTSQPRMRASLLQSVASAAPRTP